MPSDQALLEAVNELRRVVEALTKVLDEEYPKRHEVEERFSTKEGVWRRVKLFSAAIVLALVASFFVTIGTVSSCFLSGEPHPSACSLMPGYTDNQAGNAALIEEFRTLQERSARNEARLRRVEEALMSREPGSRRP